MTPFLLLSSAALLAASPTLQVAAKAGTTLSALKASADPVEVGSFTFQNIEWKIKCAGDSSASSGLKCAAYRGNTRRAASSVSYIGETEKNLGISFGNKEWGADAGFMVEISGVNAG